MERGKLPRQPKNRSAAAEDLQALACLPLSECSVRKTPWLAPPLAPPETQSGLACIPYLINECGVPTEHYDKPPVHSLQQDPGAASSPGSARRQDFRSQPPCAALPDCAASACSARSAGAGKHGCCDRRSRRTVSVAAGCGKSSPQTSSVK